MAKFKLDETLYESLEVEIRGKTYKVVPMDRKNLKRITALGDQTTEGKTDAAYELLEVYLGQKPGTFDGLRPNDLRQIINFISENLFRAERIDTGDAKKKVKKTGVKKSRS